MILSIASGKGGTGKTTVAAALALSLRESVQLLDCDVEEPNAHIFIRAELDSRIRVCTPVPEIDKATCDFCGKCQEVCSFNAIAVLKDNVLVFDDLCHGCGSCSFFCPRGAIREAEKEIGFVEMGTLERGSFNGDEVEADADGNNGHGVIHFVHGRLKIGQAMSPPLIRAVKQYVDTTKTVIIDAPPGTSCPGYDQDRDHRRTAGHLLPGNRGGTRE
jgi:MinD superfamily P-loop ATPase